MYAANSGTKRKVLWDEFRFLKYIIQNMPWVMLSDFNVTIKVEEYSVGGSYITGDMQDLIDCVNEIEMEDISSSGLFFTWLKSQKNPDTSTMKKLDRILINEHFMKEYGEAFSPFMPFMTSDHSVAILVILECLRKRSRAFIFTDNIIDKKEFLPIVEEMWNSDVDEYNMYRVFKKLKALKVPMKKLNWQNGNLFERIELCRSRLKDAQRKMEKNPFDDKIKFEEAECLASYLEVIDYEEKFIF